MNEFSEPNDHGHVLGELDQLLKARVIDRPEGSYVSSLFDKGQDAVLQKVGEESTEFIIAAKNLAAIHAVRAIAGSQESEGDPDLQARTEEAVHEMADLLFHSMIALAQLGLSMDDVLKTLKQRQQKP